MFERFPLNLFFLEQWRAQGEARLACLLSLPSRETPFGLFLHDPREHSQRQRKAAAGGESLALSGDYSYATADCRELHITHSVTVRSPQYFPVQKHDSITVYNTTPRRFTKVQYWNIPNTVFEEK